MYRVRTSAAVQILWFLPRWTKKQPLHLNYFCNKGNKLRRRLEFFRCCNYPSNYCLNRGEILSTQFPINANLTCCNKYSSSILSFHLTHTNFNDHSNTLQRIQPFLKTIAFSERASYSLVQHRWHSSSGFIRSVLEQVKKDLDNQPELRKAMQDLRFSANEHRSLRFRFMEKLEVKLASLRSFFTIATTYSIFLKRQLFLAAIEVKNKIPLLDSWTDWVVQITRKSVVIFKFMVKKMQFIMEKFQDEKAGEKRTAEWRRSQAIKRYKSNQSGTNKTTDTASTPNKAEAVVEENIPAETALVLAKESAWDRFGTKLKDMPFLQNFFENPFIGKLFGETEIAASIREMKLEDSSFRLPEFMETVEEVVAPHLIDSFLQGDTDSLRLHCGEAAFSAAASSIRERELMKVQLDPSVLQLRGVELKGARRVEDGTPWFIFTFTAQQINCLRDSQGTVVSGAIDDIREVVYSMALTKHPEPETLGLHHPWMVKELAIIGNTACW